jgi:DNA topoisomerase-1
MPRSLVIVESPAKAKTISRFLGDDFEVKASVGHVADLPSKGLAVDVDNGFKPTYELTTRGKEVVKELRAALKDADELYLATDEDREGEAISWHLLEALKPRVPVKRMVFHEITRSAIDAAVASPRGIDYGLVDAAETRRILDRLYGYEVSPVLWKKVNAGLSAGRVQSPSTRLVVEREWERIRFVAAGYWDIDATFATDPGFTGTLVAFDGQRVATGRDFDENGRTKRQDVRVLDEPTARGLADRLASSDFAVRTVEEKPYRSTPKAPFMTSTLQQEGSRKLNMSASQVMRVAQGLYERGYITYMRTDSTLLSEVAVGAARAQVTELFGQQYLSDTPRRWEGKVKNAQEAHEAIRPAGESFRAPADLARELSGSDLRLYEMIWMRTLASQMADATGRTVTVRIGATSSSGEDAEFSASGTTITFPGYRRAYVEGSDDPDAELADQERLLPALEVGQRVPLGALEPKGHTTTPPPRYTEASLVKRLEELGIGRPSTYASIMQTIQDRGYVWKRGGTLVPTWTAFAVVNLLERHFETLVDYAFTARMEDDLDAIARNELAKTEWLSRFYFGNGDPGLKRMVHDNLDLIDAAEINSIPLGLDANGEPVVVKPGRYGPYVKRGEDTASVPENLPPDELTLDRALELLAAPRSDEPIGTDDISGLPIYARNGRFGPYVQLGDADTLPAGEKPKMASLFKTMTLEALTLNDARDLLSLPRGLGVDPSDGEPVEASNGRYGPFVRKGKEYRSIDTEERLLTITLDEALALLAQPRVYRGRGAPKPPLREFGEDPVSGRPIVAKEGRFGTYVTDGETNASLRRGDLLEEITAERAAELLAERREAGPSKPRKTAGKTAKKAGATKTVAKKTTTKKAAAKKSPAKKATAAKTPSAEAE